MVNDEKRISQILINLLSNSLKFTKNGMIYIVLNDLDEYTVLIEVIDNGTGIQKKK
jgi:signal transduction histidine kinase